MSDGLPEQNFLFKVQTPLNFSVHVTQSYWNLIVTVKHPIMAKRKLDVKEAIEKPEEIRQSRKDPAIYLFYKSKGVGRWTCAVVKRTNAEGF